MRRLIAATYVSLDGVMQAPGTPEEDPSGGFAHGGWTFPYWDEAMLEAIVETFAAPFDLLLGRRTYEMFAAHWPYRSGDPIADRFNSVRKYVATSSAEPLAWRGSIALRGDIAAEVARLKREEGPELLVQGSSMLLQALLRSRLVDEFSLMTFPVILAGGKRLFGDCIAAGALELIESRTSATGVVSCRYRPAGAVRTGSFAPEQPSAAEQARRERLRKEMAR